MDITSQQADFNIIGEAELDTAEVSQGLSAMSLAAGNLIAELVKKAVSGAKRIVQSVVQTGMSFDSSMSQVAATMGVTVDEIQGLANAAKEAGSTTAFTATQAAQALNYLALAGYDAETAAEVLPSVLNLAAAGGLDLAYASDLATDAMASLGIEASKANLDSFGNELAKTASSANANVAQLGEAILTVGGTAKALAGTTYTLADGTTVLTDNTTELNTALGLLANIGIKGSEGGTHLRNVLLSLQSPGKEAKEIMTAMGLSVYDTEGKMRPLNEILMDLSATMDGLTDGERNDIINAIFNKTDLAAVNGLLAASGEQWANLALRINESGGAAQEMADTQLNNLSGNMTKLSSAAEGLALTLYEQLKPGLTEMSGAAVEAVQTLGQTLSTAGPEAMVEAAANMIGSLAQGFAARLPELITTATELVVGFAGYIGDHADEMVKAALNMITWLVRGLAANLPQLVKAATELIVKFGLAILDNSDQIVRVGVKTLEFLAEGLLSAVMVLVGAAAALIARFLHVWDDSADDYATIGANLVQGLINGILGMAGKAVDTIKSLGGSVLKGLKDKLGIASPSKATKEIGEFTAEGMAVGIEAGTPKVEAAARRMAQSTVQIIDEECKKLNTAIDSTQGAFDVLTKATDEYNETGAISIDTYQQLIGLDTNYLNLLVEENGQLHLDTDAYRELLASQMESLQAQIKLNGANSEAIGILTRLGDAAMQSAEMQAQAAASTGYAPAYSWGADMVGGLVDSAKAGVAKVKEAASGLANGFKRILHFSRPDEGPLRDYEQWMPDFMAGLAGGIEANRYRVTDALRGMLDEARGIMLSSNAAMAAGSVPGVLPQSSDGDPGEGRSGAVIQGGVHIVINAADYTNVNEIAEAVANRLQQLTEMEGRSLVQT